MNSISCHDYHYHHITIIIITISYSHGLNDVRSMSRNSLDDAIVLEGIGVQSGDQLAH